MFRLSVFVGFCVVAFMLTGLLGLPDPEFLTPANYRQVAVAVQPETEPIPAIPTAPILDIPRWSLYAGSATCFLIALVMLWRCNIAGQCPWQRRFRSPSRR